MNANNGGQCVFFVSLVMMQIFGNLWATRNRHLSLYHNPPWNNPRLFAAMVVSIAFAAFFVYVPIFQTSIGTYPIPAQYWFYPIPCGFSLIILDELRKYIVRGYPNSFLAKAAW